MPVNLASTAVGALCIFSSEDQKVAAIGSCLLGTGLTRTLVDLEAQRPATVVRDQYAYATFPEETRATTREVGLRAENQKGRLVGETPYGPPAPEILKGGSFE